MRIFYAVRLFSGFETSLESRTWCPTGAPTIYKVMEALDRGEDEPIFTMVCRESYMPWYGRDSSLHISGLRHPISVLALQKKGGRIRKKAHEIKQSLSLFNRTLRASPDIAYFSNANVLTAALVSRFTGIPTVLRIMGIYPEMRSVVYEKNIIHGMTRWAYQSPFSCVICTQDGSGGERWLEKAMRPGVPTKMLLNGVDIHNSPAGEAPRILSLPSDRMIVTYIGKLEPEKGALEFIRGFRTAYEKTDKKLHALVVGTGRLKQAMLMEAFRDNCDECATFIDRLPHEQIAWAHSKTDVYVSLNKLGSLSNANLEAMRSGSCMIIPRSNPVTGIDSATDRLVPDGCVVRIPSPESVENLAEELVRLYEHPEERMRLKSAMLQAAKQFIPTWRDRVQMELEILRRLSLSAFSGRPGS